MIQQFVEDNDRLDRAFLDGDVRQVVSDMAQEAREEFDELERETESELGGHSPSP